MAGKHLLILLLLVAMPLAAAESPLARFPSPYIRLHANDPVQWRLWDESLLKQAKREHKLLFISSGYYACHWCHVMQRESFQNAQIAEQLNRHFIPVKIDRELWPELDAYLIAFVDKTRGSAGWPLNVFITPEGYPLLGTTYLPPQEFSAFALRLQERWKKEAGYLSSLARRAAMSQRPDSKSGMDNIALAQAMEASLLSAWEAQGDLLAGGFGQQAKFPQVPLLHTLARIAGVDSELKAFVQLTLDQMASLGLRDHLAGGFFRYTTDPGWQEPHFEKMLIDNAQLAYLYLELAQRWQVSQYREIGLETLDFLLGEMRHPKGGFISALSAVDRSGEEGGYYLWTDDELRRILGQQRYEQAREIWSLHHNDTWQAGGLLLPHQGMTNTVGDELADVKETLRRVLLQARQQRHLPKDNKRLALSNGLVLAALSRVLEEKKQYRHAAEEVRDYLFSLWDGSTLWRMRDLDGNLIRQAGFEDYIQVSRGLLHWAEASNDGKSRELAVKLLQVAWQRFHSETGWQVGALAPPRPVVPDAVLPSPVSVMAELAHTLGRASPLTLQRVRKVLTAAPTVLITQPMEYASYLTALRQFSDGGG